MLPSMLRNILWGSQEPAEPEREEVQHTTQEEDGDWLLISHQNSCDSGNSNSNSRVNSECDLDSVCSEVCSDASWVITPAPTFKRSSTDPAHPSLNPAHSLEDLLIEHPTMSVYHRQNSSNENTQEAAMTMTAPEQEEVPDETSEEQNQIRELALIENERRRQLAAQMEIPLTTNKVKQLPPKESKQPKLTRRALKRHNPMTRHGTKYQVQKCNFKAGRRRC